MPSQVCSIGSWVAFIATLSGVVWGVVPFDGQTAWGLAIFFIIAMFSGMIYAVQSNPVKRKEE